MIVLWASARFCRACFANSFIPLGIMLFKQISRIIEDMYPTVQFEWCVFHCPRYTGIDCEFSKISPVHLVFLIIADNCAEDLSNVAVSVFGLAIHLGMVGYGH
jgi:hypothetical protein